MAVLVACANGNLTSASTWEVADATSYLNSETANTALTTSVQRSSTFTPGAVTIDAIAVKIASRAASPSGTITVRLDQGTTLVTGTDVTINVADLPLCTTTGLEGGWALFKLAAPVTLLAATAYSVAALTSASSQVNLWAASGTNWSRAIRTTTTQAPAAGDDMIIAGEKTGAGAQTTRTVTMDSTAATDYGNNSTGPTGLVTPALAICTGGALTFGSTASTNYVLQLSGNLIIYAGGTLNMGTAGTPIPRTSTATLQFDCAAARDFGLTARNLSTWNSQGLSRTSGKDIWCCLLAANAASSATALTVDRDTGWLSGDVIAIAATAYSSPTNEKKTLSANATSSGLAITVGLSQAHDGGGTDPYVVAEVLLLTRNVILKSVSASFGTFVAVRNTAAAALAWTEFTQLNGSAQNAAAFQIDTIAGGSLAISFCAFHDSTGFGISLNNAANDSWSIASTGMYLNSTGSPSFNLVQTTGSAWSINGFWAIGGDGQNFSVTGMVDISDLGAPINDLRAICATNGNTLRLLDITTNNFVPAGQVQNIVCHNGSFSTQNSGYVNGYIDNFTYYRYSVGNGTANDFNEAQANICTILRNPVVFEVGDQCCLFVGFGQLKLVNPILAGGTSRAAQSGVQAQGKGQLISEGGSYGTVTGSRTAFTTACILTNQNSNPADHYIDGATIGGSGVPGVGQTSIEQGKLFPSAGIHITRRNGVANDNTTYRQTGDIASEATIFRTSAPSAKLIPRFQAWTGQKHEGPQVYVAANSGAVKTVSVYVRKDASYSGNQPRLMLKANGAMGVNEDTVLATMLGGAGVWEQLTASLPSAPNAGAFACYVDCDGTSAQPVYVDDWSVA